MKNYLDLLRKIMDDGVDKGDRTGVGTRSLFGETLRFNLQDGFPIVTTRKVALRIAFEETMLFLRGETDTKKLEEKNINIWKGNTSREFLDNRGLSYLPEGHMGKGYSHQWRHFNGDQDADGCSYGGVDQLSDLISGLKQDPNGRRHLITAWNPSQTDEMALPPCHIMHQYVINDGQLDSCFYMRSNDVPFGLPYNIMGYALLNHFIASIVGVRVGELVYFGADVHIYQNQFDLVNEQLTREPYPLPKLKINRYLDSLHDLMDLEFDDIELVDYKTHGRTASRPPMAE